MNYPEIPTDDDSIELMYSDVDVDPVPEVSSQSPVEVLLGQLLALLQDWRANATGAPLAVAESKPRPIASLSAVPFADEIPNMDPKLQRLIARKNCGEQLEATASTTVDEVAVIARVTDVSAWEGLSEVRVGATIGGRSSDDDFIVTGRIPVGRIVAVRQQPFVKSLKAAHELRPMLDATTAETLARPDLLPRGHRTKGGSGVVVGVIDYGCDFAHRNFRNANGSTRLLSLWHQDGQRTPESPFDYGRKYKRAEIDAALKQADPYAALGYGPRPDNMMPVSGTHGTHVMDIAAGNGRGSGVPGLAPQADLVFVDVSHTDIPFVGPTVVDKSFGDSTRLLEACQYIFEQAGTRPCVINISLGTNGGPHDGSTLVEQGVDRLLSQQPNRAVVISASNSFDDGIHAAGMVLQDGNLELQWQVAPNDDSQNELDLWYAGADRFDLELIAPDGTPIGRVTPGQNLPLQIGDRMALFASSRLDDPNNHDNVISIFLEKRFVGWDAAGTWTLRIHGTQVSDGRFHAWVERDNRTPSRFVPPHDNSHTLGSISCGRKTIAVGSYDARKLSRPISFFSSAGPTRDNRNKPEVSAPGHAVFAAHSRTGTAVIHKSGTSMAAPAVAGICALIYAEAAVRGVELTIDQLRDLIEKAARQDPPSGGTWHARYGTGRISAQAAVAEVMSLAGGVPTAARPRRGPAPSAVSTPAKRKSRKKSRPARAETRSKARQSAKRRGAKTARRGRKKR